MTKKIALLFVMAATLAAAGQDAHPRWSYDGATGPAYWGDLESDFATCKTGVRQSPIDIRTATVKADLPAIQFDYKPSAYKIIDNGHTIQISYPAGSFIHVGDKTYQLVQFHFHHPSEELIHGKPSAMVIHLVHSDTYGNLAVVAVLVRSGASNPLLKTLFGHLPEEKSKAEQVNAVIDLTQLLPQDRAYYTFPGSLTIPPCSENVTWFVLKNKLDASTAELDAFSKLYSHNARPVQPLNGRVVLQSR